MNAGEVDGLVLLPKAGGYTSEQLIEMQDMTNRQRAAQHAQAQVRNLSWQSGVTRVSSTIQGMLSDWLNGSDHSVQRLFLCDNRLQGLGLLLIAFALAGLVIDAVLRKAG